MAFVGFRAGLGGCQDAGDLKGAFKTYFGERMLKERWRRGGEQGGGGDLDPGLMGAEFVWS